MTLQQIKSEIKSFIVNEVATSLVEEGWLIGHEIGGLFYEIDYKATFTEGEFRSGDDYDENQVEIKEIEIRNIYDTEGELSNENLKALNSLLWIQ